MIIFTRLADNESFSCSVVVWIIFPNLSVFYTHFKPLKISKIMYNIICFFGDKGVV